MADKLVVKVTAGVEAPERSNQAFTVAAAAVAAGVEVAVWLTGEAAWFAVPGRAAELSLEYATPLPELLEVILDGGTVTVCTQCAARRNLTADGLLAGVTIGGAAGFVEAVMQDGTQALVY
ncbi:DsrE family protein [Spongisporangium articulatum]|uniref:DsrE family protein n=1 Tax=Spongisporangium articulatum TaxID=3362603 RepID=A0ABW8AJQ6_9ACTN